MMYIVSIYGSKELLEQVKTCSVMKTDKIEFLFTDRNFELAKAKFVELSKLINELATVLCKDFYRELKGSGIVAKYYLADNSAFVTLTQYNTV